MSMRVDVFMPGALPDDDFVAVAALCAACDDEFCPPLSERGSTTWCGLSAKGDGSLDGYLADLRLQAFTIARVDGRVVGFLSWIPEAVLTNVPCCPIAYVTTVIVDHELRSRGIGHALYHRLFASSRGPFAVRTRSTNGEHAALLSSLGWRAWSRIPNARDAGVDTVYYVYGAVEANGDGRVPLKLLMTEDAGYVPTYAHATDAGIDLRAVESYDIEPGESVMVRTGVRAEIPAGYFGLECPRSGLGAKGITMRNAIGVIDSGYRGEILCALWNTTDETFHVDRHNRVCQLIIVPYVHCDIVRAVDSLADSDRGEGGYGSTGVL